jgi:hypothetical protein
MLIYAG